MTSWSDVAKLVVPLAPGIGGILGSLIPIPGGSLIGSALGKIIAKQFGVEPTPEAVADAIRKTDADVAIAKLEAANERARIEIEGYVQAEEAYVRALQTGLEETNRTMRFEALARAAGEHWFFNGWRPACGWLIVVSGSVYGAMLIVAMADAAFWSRPEPLQIIANAWPAFLSYFGTLSLLVGVYVFARSSEKNSLTAVGKPPIPTTTKSVAKK